MSESDYNIEEYDLFRLKEIFRCYYINSPKKFDLIKQISYSSGLNKLFRKVAWCVYLDVLPSPISPIWEDIMKANRERYDTFMNDYFGDHSNDDSDKSIFLSRNMKCEDDDDVINKDIDRLFVDIPFFYITFSFARPYVFCEDVCHDLILVFFHTFDNLIIVFDIDTDLIHHLKTCLFSHGLDLADDFADKTFFN